MTLKYTGEEAVALVYQTYPETAGEKVTETLYKIVRYSLDNNVTEDIALQTLLKGANKADAIILVASYQRLLNSNIANLVKQFKIRHYENQRLQITKQQHALNTCTNITEKATIRSFYIQKQSILTSKINQLLNACTVVEPRITNFRLDRR